MPEIAVLLYDRVTALDAVGPYEVLQRWPDARLRWLAPEPGVIRTDEGKLALLAEASLEDVPRPDRGRGSRAASAPTPCSMTSAYWTGCAAPTRARVGRPRCVRARSCWAPRGS